MASGAIRVPTVQNIDLGQVSGVEAAWDAITCTDTVLVGKFIYSGTWMFMAYKYSGSANGMMWAQKYSDWEMTILSVNNGTKRVHKVALQS